MFQSTRPRGARHDVEVIDLPVEEFQSTRPRGARLPDNLDRRDVLMVSIHAPTRGATPSVSMVTEPAEFQSTRPRGARPRYSGR